MVKSMERKKLLIRTAFWIMVATLGSRLLGFLREVQLAYFFGLTPMRGAFTVAFKIPNLIRLLIADAAISAAFIPVFTELLMKKDKDEAWKVGSQMMNVTFLILAWIVLLCEIFMPFIIQMTTPGFVKNRELFEHTVQLSRIIFPIIIILGLGGVVVGVLHSMQYFGAPAVAPLFWNVINILAVFLFYNIGGIYAAAWGLLAATIIQFIIQGSPFTQIPWKYTWRLGLSDPVMKRIGLLMIPVTLSIGVINFNALVGNFFASLLGPSEVAAIDSAFRLFHLPQGMFAIAIGTVLFPLLSGFIVTEQHLRFSNVIQTGLRQIFFVTLPFTGWFMTLSFPIAKLCFERGQFTESDSRLVAWALLFYSIGMSFTSANTLLNRGFYSLKKTWIPLYTSVINIGLNILLCWLLLKPLGVGGICFATSFVSICNFFALSYLMKREVREFNLKPVMGTLIRCASLTLLLSAVSYMSYYELYEWLGKSFWSLLLSLGGGILAGAIVYAGVAWWRSFKEVEEALILVRKDTLPPPSPASPPGR